ncbi:hypothetical protein LPUS_09834 [Lasallia pustulata]|uniref:DUF6590 domain-containing protein n=1 Tax=Lasallia pustulata TaxID=136370 RepID=A0A1W5D8R5_9LECA|nr:hypothetical protein LPUS_09834 [Lasallia pustulata]
MEVDPQKKPTHQAHPQDPRPNNLDPNQFKMVNEPHKFFVVGKVIKVFYIANAGGPFPDRESVRGKDFTTVALGEIAHHSIRRFVIVKKWSDEWYCYGLPITTYGGRGTTKPGVNQSVHAIIHTGTTPPSRLQGEGKMNKDPLQMIEISPDEKLDSNSRLNLRKHHVIEYNWKVKEIGNISSRSLPKLMAYWRASRENTK